MPVTQPEVMEIVARDGGPEAAAVLAMVFEHQASMRENMLPTWDVVERTRREAYRDGYAQGHADAESAIIRNILGITPREEA